MRIDVSNHNARQKNELNNQKISLKKREKTQRLMTNDYHQNELYDWSGERTEEEAMQGGNGCVKTPFLFEIENGFGS